MEREVCTTPQSCSHDLPYNHVLKKGIVNKQDAFNCTSLGLNTRDVHRLSKGIA